MNVRFESSVIVRFHEGTSAGLAAGVGTRTQPESNPPARGLQGSVNADWVIEWLPGLIE